MALIEPKWGDSQYDLLFKCVNNSAGLVSNGQTANWGDSQYDLIFKLANNLDAAAGGGSGGGGIPQTTVAPANITDFSMFGGVAPTTGVYFAPRDQITLWTIEGGDTQWTVIDKNSP